jgi:hypothetical protein
LDLSYLTDVHPQSEAVTTAGNVVPQDNEDENETVGPFDRLVLEKGHKNMIVSLIAQHFRDKKSVTRQREQFDIVKGKGNSALYDKGLRTL